MSGSGGKVYKKGAITLGRIVIAGSDPQSHKVDVRKMYSLKGHINQVGLRVKPAMTVLLDS